MAFGGEFSGRQRPTVIGEIGRTRTYDMATGSESAGNNRGIGQASDTYGNIKTLTDEIDATIVKVEFDVDLWMGA